MHKKFFIVTAILLAVAAGLATSVFAQGPGTDSVTSTAGCSGT